MCGDCIVIPKCLRPAALEVLHAAHQGVTAMNLRANAAMYWPGMYSDIVAKRNNCSTCHKIAPSNPDMPPVTPDIPCYPFQHVCSDYFQLHGHSFCVVVDRYTGWFNIHQGVGGARWLTDIFHKLFQDVGICETVTTDGGTTYTSKLFQECLGKYGVKHRVSSVGFPHGNCRAEVAVKTAKRLLRTHVPPTGTVNTLEITKALLQYRNTPDRDLGVSPAEMLYGRKLPDFLPKKPCEFVSPSLDRFSDMWKRNAEWRELALARRGQKIHDRLSEHTRDLKPLVVGDNVMVQNLLGNNPKRWDKRGVVLEVLPHRQYKIKMDGSRRISLRNRKHLKKFKPVVSEPNNPVICGPVPVSIPKEKLPEVNLTETSVTDPVSEQGELPQMMYDNVVRSDLAPRVPTTPVRNHGPGQSFASPVMGAPSQPLPYTQPPPVFTPTHQAVPVQVPHVLPPAANDSSSDGLRRSARSNKGQTTRFEGFTTGTDYDEATAGINAASAGQVLYAVKLPPGFEQVGAFWTDNGWMQWTCPLPADGR